MGPDASEVKAMREVQRKSDFNGAACPAGALLVHRAVTWSRSPALVGAQQVAVTANGPRS